MINKKSRGSSIFKSSQLSLVAALIAWNFPIVSLDRSNLSKTEFIFTNSPDLKQAIQSFWNNTAQVSPKAYFNALKEAKSRIYGG